MNVNTICLEWHTGATSIERFAIDVPNEHYADLFAAALKAAGTGDRIVWYRIDTEESA